MSLENPTNKLAPPPQQTVELSAQEWRQFFFFAWQMMQSLGSLTVNNQFNSVTTLNLDSIRFAGQPYKSGSTIQDAIDAASPSGAVIIPGTYTGTDDYRNEDNIPVLDMRNNQLGIWSWLAPSFPIDTAGLGKFPLGADLVLMSRGPADTYISKQSAQCATASNLAVGANTVTVGAVTVRNAPQGTTVTGTLDLFSDAAGIFVARGTPNEEVIAPANWTRNSATSITLTCANAHTGPVDIEQVGTFFLTTPELVIDAKGTAPPNATYHRMPIYDSDRNIIGYLPYLPDAWPYSGVALNAYLTGAAGANGDLNLRMATSSATVRCYNDTAGAIIFEITNSGNLNIAGGLTVDEVNYVVANTQTWANGVGASAGTLGNAPSAGDPTKWLPFVDNGVVRYVPSWT